MSASPFLLTASLTSLALRSISCEADALPASTSASAATSGSRNRRPTLPGLGCANSEAVPLRRDYPLPSRPERNAHPPSDRNRPGRRARRRWVDRACLRTRRRERVGRAPGGERARRCDRHLSCARAYVPPAGLGRRQRAGTEPDGSPSPLQPRLERRLEERAQAGLEDVRESLREVRRAGASVRRRGVQGAGRLVLGAPGVAAVPPAPRS